MARINGPISQAVGFAILCAAQAQFVQAQAPVAGADDLEEVVVTAQFREQKLQDTPIAITAINAEMIDARNQTSLAEVAAQAPNVVLTETGGAFGPGMAARIRGIGQSDFIAALEPGVGVYVDDVYYSSLTGANFDLLDLERVEILRGPQGTLSGRNSIGGSVKLFSQKPMGDGTGNVRATYGSRSLLDIRAMGDFALIDDSLFLRVSGVSHQQDGYVNLIDYGCANPASGLPNLALRDDCKMGKEGGKDYSAARVALRWLASDNIEVNLSGDLTLDTSPVAANVLLATGPVFQGPAVLGPVPFGPQYIPSDGKTSYASFTGYRPNGTGGGNFIYWEPFTDTTVWGTNLTVDWKLTDGLALKSITAYREFDSRWVEDNDVSPASLGLGNEHQTNYSFSQELRLNGSVGSAIDYTVGAYYFDQTTIGRTHQMLNYVPTPFLFEFLSNDPTDASSYAVFADGTWHATDRLNVNAGIRYTKESKDYTYSRLNPDGTPNILLGSLTGVTSSYDGSHTDWRVNVDYRWNDALMTYASVSTGFKGGGTNPRPFNVPQVQTFGPETLTAYEIGAKSDLFNRTLRLNAAAFFNKYKDIQVTLLSCPQFSPGPCAVPVNGGDADVKGLEVEVNWNPIDHLSFDGSWSKLDFEYTRLAPNTGIPVGSTAPGTIEDKWSVGAQYEFLFASGASLTPRFDWSYQGGYNTNAVPTAGNRVPGYHMGNVRVTWNSAQSDWQVSALVTNVFDEYYFNSTFDLTSLGGGSNYGFLAPPREYSVQIQKKF